jgi:hypothetical protein
LVVLKNHSFVVDILVDREKVVLLVVEALESGVDAHVFHCLVFGVVNWDVRDSAEALDVGLILGLDLGLGELTNWGAAN